MPVTVPLGCVNHYVCVRGKGREVKGGAVLTHKGRRKQMRKRKKRQRDKKPDIKARPL